MYQLMKLVAKLVIFLTTRYTVSGVENIPLEGPLMIVSNHLSVGDPVFIGTSMRRKVIFMAKEDLFHNRLAGFFIRQFGAFPVSRGKSNIKALHQANQILKEGKALGMFPEGKRSNSKCLMPGLRGSALVASYNRVKILPVGISGSEIIHGYLWMWRRPRVTLKIGRPFALPETDNIKKEHLDGCTDIIMKEIAALLPEEYRGVYRD